MDLVKKYFPDLTEQQYGQFRQMEPLYRYWNERVNLISRKDVHQLYSHHVLHSLSIGSFTSFVNGTDILDIGTGGGFPGIPLAILFPEVNFHLVDVIVKKTMAVVNIARELGLQNVRVDHIDVKDIRHSYDFVVARAVASAHSLVIWAQELLKDESNNDLPNGLILLKGGDLESELAEIPLTAYTIDLSQYFEEEFFKGKCIVYLTL